MKLFLDTAHLPDIEALVRLGIIDGVTTNPTSLSKETGDIKDILHRIIRLFPDGCISVEVTEDDPERVYQQAQAIAALGKNVWVKIPCHPHYYSVIHKLVQEGIKLNITLVFTLMQGLMMCKLGVSYISPFIGRSEDADGQPSTLLYELRDMIDTYGFHTHILAASLRTVQHVHEAVCAGAHVATLSPALFKQLINNPLTDMGMEKFARDWAERGITKFP